MTAAITRVALQRQRAAVLARYLADVEALGRVLSISALRARTGSLDELMASIEHDRERLPEVAAHARPRTLNEPWREKLWYVQARLRATLEHGEHGYVDAARYRADLARARSSPARGGVRERWRIRSCAMRSAASTCSAFTSRRSICGSTRACTTASSPSCSRAAAGRLPRARRGRAPRACSATCSRSRSRRCATARR